MNKRNIINQIVKAINTYPTDITLMRMERVDDGEGNYTNNPQVVESFIGFIDNSGSSLSITLGDKGRIERVNKIALINTYNESFEIKTDDFFQVGSTNYTIINPVNHFDICWISQIGVVK